MTPVPPHPPIYHITHVDNLGSILAAGGLFSYAATRARGEPGSEIGMTEIKERRLRLPVRCHPGDQVGDYVPFYFCPRSIMLYLVHCANHPNLAYRGGQGPIVHLEADLREVVAWAEAEGRRWAFSLSNAGAAYAEFRDRLDQLDDLDWAAIQATDFRDRQVKEGKQAEFLLHGFFPWHLVRRVGVHSESIRARVSRRLQQVDHGPVVDVLPRWYF